MPRTLKNPFKKGSQDYLKLLAFRDALEATKLTRAEVGRMFHYTARQLSDFYYGRKPVPILLLKKIQKKFVRDGFYVEKDYDPLKAKRIEPGIKQLVTALNATGILKTFSSCEGHYNKADQTIDDRNRADVRFYKSPNLSEPAFGQFMEYILYEARKADIGVVFWAYKSFIPRSQPVYIILIEPYDRLAHAAVKRKLTDAGIAHMTAVVKKAGQLLKDGKALELTK